MAVQVVNSSEMGSLFRRVSVKAAYLFVQGTPYGPLASTTRLGFGSKLFFVFQVGFTTSPKHNTNLEIVHHRTSILSILAKAPEIISSAFYFIICFFASQADIAKKSQICRCLLPNISIHRTVGVASTVVLSFFIHTESVPCGGAVDVGFVYVVHAHGATQHTAHGNKVKPYHCVSLFSPVFVLRR